MPEYKSQHYVPEFYLGNFSKDNCITCLQIKDGNVLSKIPYNNQCQKDYYYGEVKNEKELGKIETKISIAIRDIINGKSVNDEMIHYIRLFISLQQLRTPSWMSKLSESIEKLLGKKISSLLNIRPEKLLRVLDCCYKGIEDLSVVLVSSNADCLFLTSDNPVVLCNPLFSNDVLINHTGAREKGLVIFCPISSNRLAVLFDSSVYEIGDFAAADSICINKLTIMNAEISVYAHPNFPLETLELFYNDARKKCEPRIDYPEFSFKTQEKQIRFVQMPRLNFNEQFDFLKIKINANRYRLHKYYERHK